MKFYRFFAMLLAAASLFVFSACGSAPSKAELTDEEAHKLCETYKEEVAWIGKSSSGPAYIAPIELSFIAEAYTGIYKEDIPVCTFEVKEAIPNKNGFDVKIQIKKVYFGDSSYEGKEYTGFAAEISEKAVGQTYFGPLVGIEGSWCYFHTFWTFLVTEDNKLVNFFGCQQEEANFESEAYSSNVEGRTFTGQSPEYVVSLIEGYIAEFENASK